MQDCAVGPPLRTVRTAATLLALGGFGAAVVTSSVAAQPTGPATHAAPSRASARTAAATSTAGLLAHIKHIIFIVKENRSYDGYFGRYQGGNGATVGHTLHGERVLGRMADSNRDLRHDRNAMVHDINHGRMNGFSSMPRPRFAYTAATRSLIPNYWAYADHYTLADRMFSSVAGPSLPNHLYSVAAQSAGLTDDRGYSGQWGCDAPPTERVPVWRNGRLQFVFPCFAINSLGA
jgi:phospholipase C